MSRIANKFWRESASIIALAKNPKKPPKNSTISSDYKILLQQRSGNSGFLPNTIVFPGGTESNCDSSQDWYEHFKSFGIKNEKFMEFHSSDTLTPPILQDENPINRHVSLRITAIREAFEELGVLICRSENYDSHNKYAKFITDFDVKYWQQKIHREPLEFISLCQHLKCFPDIWSLYLWSNWLTPIGYENQRFDTIFFLTAFESTPPVYAEQSEVSKFWWGSPEDVLLSFNIKKILLPPPQWYEMKKLYHQKNIDELIEFSARRSSLGCEQIYPILLYPKKGKGWIAIFPGDELYPEKPDFEKQTAIPLEEKTIDELQKSANITHRMELYDLYTLKIQLKNFIPFQSQLSPIHGVLPDISN